MYDVRIGHVLLTKYNIIYDRMTNEFTLVLEQKCCPKMGAKLNFEPVERDECDKPIDLSVRGIVVSLKETYSVGIIQFRNRS